MSGSEPCQATIDVVNKWYFSPSRDWQQLDAPQCLNFTVKIRPKAELQKIGVPRKLVPQGTTLPPVAMAMDFETVRPKKRVKPAYPILARRKRMEGLCEVAWLIDEQGQVYDTEIVECPNVFHDATLKAAKGWKFHPMIDEGTGVKSKYLSRFKFVLN